MSRQTIALDIDDVLAGSTDAIRLFVNERFNVSLEAHHYQVKGPYWGYYEVVWANHDIDGDGIIDDFHQQYTLDPSVIGPVEGAVRALRLLSRQYRLVAVSSRAAEQQLATERWLTKQFGEVFDAVLCIDSHHNDISKGEVCQSLGAAFLIDDNIEHCASALDHGLQPILFGAYGWHDEATIQQGFVRCSDWTAVLEYFDERA